MKFFSRPMIPLVAGLMASLFCRSQPVNTDSLLKLLPSSPADKKITILLRLTRAFETADNTKTLLYGKEGIAMARANNDEASEALLWYEMGKSLLYYNRNDSGRKFFDQSLNMAKKLNDSAALGRAWNGIAYSLYGVDILDTAIAYAFIARKFMKPEQNPVDYSYNCQLLGVAYSDLGNLSTSQKYFSEGLQYAEKSGDKVRYAEMSMHFGSSYIRHHRYAEAQKWIAKAADLFARTEDSYGLYASYNALGRIAIALGDHDAAMNYHEKSLELSRQRNDTYSIAIELTNTGKILLERGDYAASLERLSEAARITRESRSLYAQRAVYESLNDYYIATKKFDSATYYRDLYRAMFDSISSEDITGKVADMQVKYETEKKEKALAHQQLLVAQQDARISRQQFTLAILAGALIILLGGGWLFYNRYRLRQKLLLDTAIIREQKQGLKAVIEAQDNERRRIAKDLHDGIAQELVALKFAFVRLSKKLIPQDKGEKEIMDDLVRALDASCTEVRNISHVMAPRVLEEQGLIPALENLFRISLSHTGIAHEFEHSGLNGRLQENVETSLYRITQELVNNILKHSGATHVKVELKKSENSIALKVAENGKGFDFEEMLHAGSSGLFNILSRVNILNGSFTTGKGGDKEMEALIKIPLAA